MRRTLTLLALLAAGLAPAPGALAADPGGALARIAAARQVRVCIWPDYYSITYRDPRTRQLSGIDIDMARELGRDLGVAPRFVDSSFASLVDDLLAERCDVAMFAVGITPARAQKLRFTQPHLASDIYAVSAKANRRIKGWDDIDQPGTVVAVAAGTLHEPVMREQLKAARCWCSTPRSRASRRCRPGAPTCS
jgi:cyclohexadienyl dehydratase